MSLPNESKMSRNGRVKSFTLRPVATACAALIFSNGGAFAQTSAVELGSVAVTGIRKSLEDSVNIKRTSDSIVEAVSAEDLGKLPDSSIAESLARLPGVTGQRGPDGRVNVISIRGLSPEFAGSLLNGREIVSSNDTRTVEYDQFPSELIGSAVVYKTPDGTLIGQGLSGTVDLRARRPLDTRGREIAVNLRGQTNSNGELVGGVSGPIGSRFSVSYVDQYADNTIGLAVGYARLSNSTQMKQTELVEYGDYTPFGLPLSGNALAAKGGNQSLLPMFWTATSSSKQNTRDGLMAVLEFKPNADLHSTVDLYYSKFKTHEVGGKFLSSQFADWGAVYGAGAPATSLSNLGITQQGANTFTTSATASMFPVTTGNFDTTRSDNITALGWNTELKLSEKWKGIADVSFSRDERKEAYMEAYAAPYNNSTGSWIWGGYKWNVPINGDAQTFTPLQSGILANAGSMAFGDVPGFDFVPGNPRWIGAIRTPVIQDEIKSLRLSAKHDMDGFFSGFTGGVNYTQRDKDVAKNESRILMPSVNGVVDRRIPASVVGSPTDMSWAGIPQLIRIDVPALVATGAYGLEDGQFSKKVGNDSGVHEKILTTFIKFDIESSIGSVPIRGNVGLQAINTQQNSEGWEYRGNDDHPDISLLFKRTGGASYTDYLPSLNLVGDLSSNWIGRFGLAKTLARPNIIAMRAGTSTPTVVQDPAGTPHAGEWSMAYSGNPELEPWRATAIDLSLEKYFGKRSYISIAAFRKDLQNYVYDLVSARDNSDMPALNVPAGVTVKKFGPVTKPTNGQGGTLDGVELSAALEGGLITPVLDGFGVVASASKLASHLVDANGQDVVLDGLSGTSASVTFYYENRGFSGRISERYRAPFEATTRDIYLNPTSRKQELDRVVDLQLGYAFESGPYKGLSFVFQMNNVFDQQTQSSKSVGANAADNTMLVPNYIYSFGRETLIGMNYKF